MLLHHDAHRPLPDVSLRHASRCSSKELLLLLDLFPDFSYLAVGVESSLVFLHEPLDGAEQRRHVDPVTPVGRRVVARPVPAVDDVAPAAALLHQVAQVAALLDVPLQRRALLQLVAVSEDDHAVLQSVFGEVLAHFCDDVLVVLDEFLHFEDDEEDVRPRGALGAAAQHLGQHRLLGPARVEETGRVDQREASSADEFRSDGGGMRLQVAQIVYLECGISEEEVGQAALPHSVLPHEDDPQFFGHWKRKVTPHQLQKYTSLYSVYLDLISGL
ncbi:hypothetical protein EYF80_042253 [Liparis tanakae]|uniref:Uncharacterized protein n=1 Tax=Liparis tanakae TaxID=230148 RepID=A0A4Z2G4N6_9TELE|nr:hypothetical protein EYF80_042253 [Liparis tanakae]